MQIYEVKLSFNNGAEMIKFPLNPSSIEIDEPGQGQTYDVVGFGEINVIKDRRLPTYSFSGLFPAQRYPFLSLFDGLLDEEKKAEVELYKPEYYIKLIGKWMNSKKPVRLAIASDSYKINTAASIESFEWQEVAGGSGDIEYSIELKKYRFYAARKIEQVTNGNGKVQKVSTPVRPNEKQQSKTYKLVAGDTLWKVAQKQLGNGTRWQEIQKLNGISDAEITRLQVGRVLKLP